MPEFTEFPIPRKDVADTTESQKTAIRAALGVAKVEDPVLDESERLALGTPAGTYVEQTDTPNVIFFQTGADASDSDNWIALPHYEGNLGAGSFTGAEAYSFASGYSEHKPYFLKELTLAGSDGRNAIEVYTEAEFDALTKMDFRTAYHILGRGIFKAGEWIVDSGASYTFGASDVHVAKTGDDTTGDGSEGNPYLTIAKGTAELTDGNTLWIHEGTYEEDTGTGYTILSQKFFNSPTSIRGVPNENVVWTCAASGSYALRINGTVQNLTFRDITFSLNGGSPHAPIYSASSTLSNVSFIDCKVRETGGHSYLAQINPTTGSNIKFIRFNVDTAGSIQMHMKGINGITVVGCKFKTTSTSLTGFRTDNTSFGEINYSGNVFDVDRAASTSGDCISFTAESVSSAVTLEAHGNYLLGYDGLYVIGSATQDVVVNFTDNIVESKDTGALIISGVNGGELLRNKISAGIDSPEVNGVTGLGVPADSGATELVQNMLVAGNDVSSEAGHSLLASSNGLNNTIRNNRTTCKRLSDFGFVVKGEGLIIDGLDIVGGTGAALYLKGVQNSTIKNVRIQSDETDGIQFALGNGSQDGEQVSGITLKRLHMEMSAGFAVNSPAGTIGAEMDFDDIAYTLTGTATWGNLLGVSLSSLTDLKAAWLSETGTAQEQNSIEYQL